MTYLPSLHLSPTQLSTSALQLTDSKLAYCSLHTAFLTYCFNVFDFISFSWAVFHKGHAKKSNVFYLTFSKLVLRCGRGFFTGVSHCSHFINRNSFSLSITAGDLQGSLKEAKTCPDKLNTHFEQAYLRHSDLLWTESIHCSKNKIDCRSSSLIRTFK